MGMDERWLALCGCVPAPPDWTIGWDTIASSALAPYLTAMAQTPQDPRWHAEGDVLTHTRMVLEQVAADPMFRALPERKRTILFLAALLHDIGKIPCTRSEDGAWKSPDHTLVGARMAREVLWRDFDLAGTPEKRDVRECICSLIRYHSLPVHILDQTDPERRLHKIAAQGELIPDLTLSLLSLLVHGDLTGRIAEGSSISLDTLELCMELAENEGIYDGPGHYPSETTEHAYLSGRKVWKGQELYDDTWGEVILMAGLPGTGKDTWIREHCSHLPVISLDDIRQELHVSPTGKQGLVGQEARERARGYLRSHQPFVWNATDLTAQRRQSVVSLFEQYHARTKIVFLETSWAVGLARNEARDRAVPVGSIEQMLQVLEIPERWEARNVTWLCT